jgi:hypothetical protein
VIVPFPYKEALPTKEIIFFGSKNLLNKILSLFEGDTTTLTYKVGCYVRNTNFHRKDAFLSPKSKY